MTSIYPEILEPTIFKKYNIQSGVTKRCLNLFPPNGFSISPADIFSEREVMSNRLLLAEMLGIPRYMFKFQKQVHGDTIIVVDEHTDSTVMYPFESDALITNVKGVYLNVTIADCCAILLHDPFKCVVAAIHSGWRGSALDITSKTIHKLTGHFGCNPADLVAYIGPCAGADVYEVGEEVAKLFPMCTKRISERKFLFDNRNQVRLQLLQSGLLPEKIEVSDICTITNRDYHSFRRDKENSGRMSCFIGMVQS